jgi:hypothetical protein
MSYDCSSFGAVYRGLDKRSGDVIAIKRVVTDSASMEEIMMEIDLLAQCKSPYPCFDISFNL